MVHQGRRQAPGSAIPLRACADDVRRLEFGVVTSVVSLRIQISRVREGSVSSPWSRWTDFDFVLPHMRRRDQPPFEVRLRFLASVFNIAEAKADIAVSLSATAIISAIRLNELGVM